MLIIALILCVLLLIINKKSTNTILGGKSNNYLKYDLRLYRICNLINNDLEIKDSTRQWIYTFYFSYINYLALYHEKEYEENSLNFPFNVPVDTEKIKEVLKIIYYDSVLKERSPETNFNTVINNINKSINCCSVVKYNIEKKEMEYLVQSYSYNLIIPKDIIKRYKSKGITDEDIIGLIIRYNVDVRYKPDAPLNISGSLLSVDPLIYKHLAELYSNKAIECFASPLNNSIPYTSVYKRDCIFPGCIGILTRKMIKSNSNHLFLANPPFDKLSIEYTLELSKHLNKSTMIIIIPCRDNRQVFNYTWGRKGQGRETDFELIKKFINNNRFKGILHVPALFMYFIALDTKIKRNITFDTLFIILSNDNKEDSFFEQMKKDIWDIISKERISTQLKKFNIGNPKPEEVFKHFDKKNGERIIKDIELGREKMLNVL